MPRPQILWYRIFAVYCALAAVSLITGLFAMPPLHDMLLTFGVCLIGCFVPLVMAIYFLRGYLGNQ